MRPRCAIVECYNRHDEVYLTTVHVLNRLGYGVDVFTTFRNRLKNSFVFTDKLDCKLHWRFASSQVLDAVAAGDGYDFVVFNTFEGAGVLDAARRIIRNVPVVGFIHNASFLRSRPQYGEFIASDRCKFAVLAPYVRDNIAATADAFYTYPVFFHDRPLPAPHRDGMRRFCVQGYFDSTRRQYSLLVDALEQPKAEGRKDFEVIVMGRNFSKDFSAFHEDIARRGLAGYLRYAWKGIGYKAYYGLLNSVDYILPLVGPAAHPEYFRTKVTSSVAAAIGFGKISVVDERLAAFYGVESASFTYTDGLTQAMRAALQAPDELVNSLRARVEVARQTCLQRSLEQWRGALAQFT